MLRQLTVTSPYCKGINISSNSLQFADHGSHEKMGLTVLPVLAPTVLLLVPEEQYVHCTTKQRK
jgi:hypothetical protein